MAKAKRRHTVKRRRRVGFSTKGKYWFDKAAANNAVWVIENLCHHVKGEWAGLPLVLEPWEKWIIEELFGWKRKDAKRPEDCTRQYRILWLEIPRKNAKSTLSAAIAIVLLFADHEPGAEIYSAAADREQASIVFDMAKAMVELEPQLSSRAQVFGGHGGNKRSIVTRSGCFYRALSADAYTKHGLNAHGLLVDEVHVQKNRDLIDTLRTSTGSRRQPIEVYITTAGYDKFSICYEMHEYAERVIEGSFKRGAGVQDDSFLPVIYAAPEGADWKSPKVWAQANPNLGVSVKREYLEQECARAQAVPGYENTFRRLHLNQWTEQASRWLKMERWDRCGGELDEDELVGHQCYAGLDLASTTDIAALGLVFPFYAEDFWPVVMRYWIPEENMRERVDRDRVPYDLWRDQGWLTTTPGDVIDYDHIRKDINDLGEYFEIKEIAIDRWNAAQITTQLDDDGFTVVPFGQGFASMAAPTKALGTMVRRGTLAHGDDPVLRWMATNVAVRQDPAGNLKPDKEKSGEKIDGIVALIMSIGRASVNVEGKSVYEERGILML